MRKEIARVKLTPGNGGYFDPITRIHLTHGDPEKPVYSGMNVSGLQAAVRNRRISVISGSLGEFIPPFRLAKNNDGRVILIQNKQGKQTVKPAEVTKKTKPVRSVAEQSAPITKQKETPTTLDQIIEDISVSETEVNVKEEVAVQEEPVMDITPELPTVEDNDTDIIQSEDVLDEVEETKEETQHTSKKNKKKKK